MKVPSMLLVYFCIASVLCTFGFAWLIRDYRQIGIQAISLPHFLIPLVLVIFPFSVQKIKAQAIPLLLSFFLVSIYMYAYLQGGQFLVAAVFCAAVYGFSHLAFDQYYLQYFGAEKANFKFIKVIEICVVLLTIAAASVSTYNSIFRTTSSLRFFQVIAVAVSLLSGFLVIEKMRAMTTWRNYKNLARIFLLVTLSIWLLVKAFVTHTDFWNFFIYHIYFWYFITFFRIANNPSNGRKILGLIIGANVLYLVGIFWGMHKGWFSPVPALSDLNGVFRAAGGGFFYYVLYDVGTFYAWIIFHVTMSWFTQAKYLLPAGSNEC